MNYYKIFILLLLISVFNGLMAQSDTNIQPLSPELREHFIQKASQLRSAEDYYGAIVQLDSILIADPADAGALIFKGDLQLQSNSFSKAVETYKLLLTMNYMPTVVEINLSYALFMDHKPSKALFHAKNAWMENSKNPQAIINYFNALLWNIKTGEAGKFLDQQSNLLKPEEVLVLEARLFTTSGNYKTGLALYDSLTRTYPNKYYVKEYAEVLLGKKEFKQATTAIKRGDTLLTTNEKLAFEQKFKATQLQNAGTEFVYFKDVSKNLRLESIIWWQQAEGTTYKVRASVGVSDLTSEIGEKTMAQFAHITVNERWSNTWSGKTDVHFQLIQPDNIEKFMGLTGGQTIEYKPNDRRMAGLVYNSEILNYTPSLLGKNIRSNSVGYVTHIMLNGHTGLFSQGSAGVLTDNNKRFLFFGSAYYLFRTEPTLKSGLNFSALHFSDSTIKIYFSPNRYFSSEVFVDFSTPLPALSKFYLQIQAAGGGQKIESAAWEPAYRFQTEIGYRINHFESALNYQTSNVASSSGTGYKFNWFTLRLLWKW